MTETARAGRQQQPVTRDRRLALTEGPRALMEMASLAPAAPYLALAPRGDGHPVLVMPGFGASDGSTTVIRGYLTAQGHATSGWTLGRNLGPAMPDLQARLGERLRQVWRAGGGRRVSLVGWSLGGVYARLLAHQYPEWVRQVITLGSPIGGTPDRSRAQRVIGRLGDGAIGPEEARRLRVLASDPLPDVPASAVYSRGDGIVPWQFARQAPSPIAENVEVYGSHVGLGFNASTLYLLADRLAQHEADWRPFQRSGWKRWVYGPATEHPAGP